MDPRRISFHDMKIENPGDRPLRLRQFSLGQCVGYKIIGAGQSLITRMGDGVVLSLELAPEDEELGHGESRAEPPRALAV